MINAFIAGLMVPLMIWQIKLVGLRPCLMSVLPVIASAFAIGINIWLAISPPS